MDKKLQDILEELIKNAVLEHDINGMALIGMPKKAIAQAKSAIEEMFREWVGEDDNSEFHKQYKEGWNDRGQEIRNRVKEGVK